MSFRTELTPTNFDKLIQPHIGVKLIGSCFSTNLFEKFRLAGIPVQANPFGIQYNPISIFQSLHWLRSDEPFNESYIEQTSDSWISWMHHHDNQYETKEQLLNTIDQARTQWNSLSVEAPIFITLGTAWVYEHTQRSIIVANCHKQPNTFFSKHMLTLEEVIDAGDRFLAEYKSPVVFTVSPVRHLRDGFVENQRSKSVLHLAIEHWENTFPQVSYFPAYELILDDLRDYRFFKDDFLHPNELAVNYIWEKLKTGMMVSDTIKLVDRVEKVMKAVLHRPLNPESNAWQKHLDGTIAKLDLLKQEGASVDWAIEQMQKLAQENR